ncbi:MAG TPA: ABC transporter substrate-binding protein [Solirubrobacteraceae bacterium]|nr:ABC transporter substrate-binding protein [Solirubrobacteraceae bacterium]
MPVGPGAAQPRGGAHGWRYRLAVVATLVALAALVAACGGGHPIRVVRRARRPASVDGITGALPPVGRPARGGTIAVGQLAGQTPSDILPLIDSASCTTPTLNFVGDLYIPLYAGPSGSTPAINERLSAAEPPSYSDGDRTVTIRLKPGLRWSDGKPVQAQDVVFSLDLLQAALRETPENWCQYSPGAFPENLAGVTTVGTSTLVLHLTHPVNPAWFTANQLQDTGAGIYPLPSEDWNVDSPAGQHVTDWATNPADAQRIYDYLHQQGTDRVTFATNPLWKVIDGPFGLESFSPADGAYALVPNRSYGLRPRARDAVVARTYATPAARLRALETGAVQIAPLDWSQLGAIPGLRRRGISVFGGPGWGWFGAVINFRDQTDHFGSVIALPYVRRALAELVDQTTIIRRVYHGWAVPAHGPAPVWPRSPYLTAAATRAPWPYHPAAAVATLRAHGWRVRPGGETTCRRPGTGPGECGPGVPAGTPIRFVWANVGGSSVGALESAIFAADARRFAGVDVRFVTGSFSFLTAEFNDQNPAAAAHVNDWGANNFGGVDTDYYPTQEGLLGLGGSLNLGGYADAVATRLMAASVTSPNPRAVSAEVVHLSRSYPVLYLPDQDWIVAVSRRLGGPPAAFRAMTQQQYPLQFLYRLRRR